MSEATPDPSQTAKATARTCPKCGAPELQQHTTRRRGGYTMRYFTCGSCGHHAKTIESPPK